jgi:hypothetical protein
MILDWAPSFHVNVTEIEAKYMLIDHGKFLNGRTIKFTLGWEVFPHAGFVFRQSSPNHVEFTMPRQYKL